ncbi:bifunctional folylpolyglutamate synthase/dihydrofolate synthase [Cohnella thailandensis]|uniref:tetrahydrofolate synthase n=1 Tax=Cohnella thailandensis TaxID=557557 RepID=A0A841SRR9_9BACL|nr:folylpolyglutamate synthase/dihydrofolate synthase family protein [Cohnella thailandensis]MBB6633902.1 bifunctional folylpolyglutamate synthase/dihydrofolate synthase [Cohnella thailandensis]MBP1972585.1 dihydrofolate synthase/folylpolyglutamate synthase [Cohnella thailandensis]
MNDQNGQGDLRTAEQAVEWITGLMPTIGIRPGLERMELLMEKLNNPHRRLKFIHVAGTNGKGSVCSFLESVLRQNGYDVGMFTSPYITSYANRFKYNGEDIPDEVLLRLANRLKPLVEEIAETEWGPPTMFEITTAIAILYYATVAFPDYVVWETGLGGRLDVTNIVAPLISVITNIGHDHMDILGTTLEEIAAEKAGIIKPGVPVVSAVTQPEAIEVIRGTAAGKKSTLYLIGEQFNCERLFASENEQSFSFEGTFRRYDSLDISLAGAHQVTNAAVAVMTLDVLRQYYATMVDEESLSEALKLARWPGRLEMVRTEPRILLDGAHNPEGMEALANALEDVYSFDSLNVMVAMMPNKNHDQSLKHILPMVNSLIVTEPDFHRKMGAADLAELAKRLQGELGGPRNIVVEPDWKKALDLLTGMAEQGGERTLSVVTGTLYLIADVRSWLLHQSKSQKGW